MTNFTSHQARDLPLPAAGTLRVARNRRPASGYISPSLCLSRAEIKRRRGSRMQRHSDAASRVVRHRRPRKPRFT